MFWKKFGNVAMIRNRDQRSTLQMITQASAEILEADVLRGASLIARQFLEPKFGSGWFAKADVSDAGSYSIEIV